MTDQDTASKLIDVASQKMDVVSSRLQELAHQYGPDVVNGALQVARIDAINACLMWLFWGIGTIVIGIIFGRLLIKWLIKENDEPAWCFASVFVFIPYTINCIVYLGLFNIWPFIGAFEPKLWIAYKLLNLR